MLSKHASGRTGVRSLRRISKGVMAKHRFTIEEIRDINLLMAERVEHKIYHLLGSQGRENLRRSRAISNRIARCCGRSLDVGYSGMLPTFIQYLLREAGIIRGCQGESYLKERQLRPPAFPRDRKYVLPNIVSQMPQIHLSCRC